MSRFWPRSMTGQLIALLLLALALAQLLSFAILRGERQSTLDAIGREQVVERAAALVRLLEETRDPGERRRILRAFSTRRLRFWLADAAVAEDPAAEPAPLLARRLDELLEGEGPHEVLAAMGRIAPHHHAMARWRRQLGEAGVVPAPPAEPGLLVAIRLGRPGAWLNAAMLLPPAHPAFGFKPLLALVATALAVSLAAAFGLRRLARPLEALADAADAVGRGEPVHLPEGRGPVEIRRTASAFNRMQERIGRAMAERTRLLAAISHDLRTPITTLRLRAEMVDDPELRARMLVTLEEMRALTEAGLLLARGTAMDEPTTAVDLGALVESLADDQADLGADVVVGPLPGERIVLRCRKLALKRALRNLVENAVRYGGNARLALAREKERITLTVDDDGPGLASDLLERVFDPFVRGEASRSPETGGSGLGLAIARAILRSHGGDVGLANRESGGLRATVHLPLPDHDN